MCARYSRSRHAEFYRALLDGFKLLDIMKHILQIKPNPFERKKYKFKYKLTIERSVLHGVRRGGWNGLVYTMLEYKFLDELLVFYFAFVVVITRDACFVFRTC